jgi:CHAD domain-containing protein
MGSPRYTGLVDTLRSWVAEPPWRGRPDRPALTGLSGALAREWDRLERAAAAAQAGRPGVDPAQHVALLHEVRRKAKHARYAAEALAPVAGDDALRLAAATAAVQDALGEHHDAAVAGDELVVLADTAYAAGQDTFTYGVLRARVDLALAANERAYEQAWAAASAPRLRRWL